MTNKVTYKISTSIVNNYIYYKNNTSKKAFTSLKNSIAGKFVSNVHMQKGLDFEEAVFKGNHGKLSELVMDLPTSIWGSKILDFGDFNIRLSGKLDALDTTKKRIYDIKRVGAFDRSTYDSSVQHLFYLYLFPEIETFYYLIASGKESDVEDIHILDKHRPENLEEQVLNVITEFFDFLKVNNLWELYITNNVYKGR